MNNKEIEIIRDILFGDSHVREIWEMAQPLIDKGATILFKLTCQKCGDRFYASKPNGLYLYYTHEDCGYDTDTINGDLGFSVLFGDWKS